MTPSSGSHVPWPHVVITGLLAVAVGLSLGGTVGPPILLAFLAVFVLPYRAEPWASRTLGVLLVVAVLWLVDRFGAVLLVLGASLFVAYLLDPAVDALERRRVARTWAILVLLVPVLAAAGGILILLVPPLVDQLVRLAEALPGFGEEISARVQALLESSRLTPFSEQYEDLIPKIVDYARVAVLTGLDRVIGATRALGGILAATLLIPIVSFYLLRDYDRIRRHAEDLLPRRYHDSCAAFGSELDRLLGRWLRGAAIVALIMGTATGIGLFLIGIPYALLLAALAGLMNFIPVIGFWISFLAAAVVALVSAGWAGLAQVGGLYVALSIVENQILQPRIVGGAVGLHPVVMLLALVVFSDLFGVLGAFLAVPLALFLLIVVRQIRGLYLRSDLYDGTGARGSPPAGNSES